MLSITSVMVLPAYFTSCAYLWKLCEDGEYPNNIMYKRAGALFTATMGALYAIWLIYAAGLQYLMLAVIILALGIPVYIWARRENAPKEEAFTCSEKVFAIILVLIAIAAIYAMVRGLVNI